MGCFFTNCLVDDADRYHYITNSKLFADLFKISQEGAVKLFEISVGSTTYMKHAGKQCSI